MNFSIRISLFTLTFAILSTLAIPSAMACDQGYFRFVGSWGAGPWNARDADYQGDEPHGLSVFMDLTTEEITTMLDAKDSSIKVGKIACGDLRDPLTYTEAPTEAVDWTEAGREKHGVLSTGDAASRADFNGTQVHNQDTDADQSAPAYLSTCQQRAATRSGGGANTLYEAIITGNDRSCAAAD